MEKEATGLSESLTTEPMPPKAKTKRHGLSNVFAACELTKKLIRTRWPLVGLAFLFAWNTLSQSTSSVVPLGNWINLASVLYLARSASLLFIGFQASRFLMLMRNTRAILLASIIGTGTVFACTIIQTVDAGESSFGIVILLAIFTSIMGFSQSFLMMAWLTRYAELSFVPLVFYFVTSNAISTAVPGILFSLSSPMMTSMICLLLPLALCALLNQTDKIELQQPLSTSDEDEAQSATKSWSFPLKPALLIAIFAFTAGYARCFFDTSGSIRVDLLGGSLTALAMLAIVAFTEVKFNLKWFHWVGLPLAVMAVVLVGHHSPVIGLLGGYCATIGFMFIQFFVCISLCTISFRHNINPLWLLAPVQALRFLGSFLGEVVGRLEIGMVIHLGEFDVSEVLVIIICLTYATFLTSRETDQSWGIEPISNSAHDLPATHRSSSELLKDECARMARRYGLTLREEEVMFLLAQGQTQAKIEKELFISNATVKTHCRHVYSKLGISGKTELINLFKHE